jgi:hypothetical protein
MPKEYLIETYLVNRVKALGGIALKGMVECKRPKGGVRTALQELTVKQLIDLNHFAFFVKTKEEVDMVLGWSRFFGDDGELVIGALVDGRYSLAQSTPKGLVPITKQQERTQ